MAQLMLERQVEVEVACSVEQVYDLWENLENVPRWIPLVKSVKPLPGESDLWRWQFGLRFPLLVEWVSRIEQRIPGQLIAWKSVSGLRNQGRAEFFPSDRGCRLRLTLRHRQGATAPNQGDLYQTILIPQHTGIEGQRE
jgi:uncharacterized membrane protein